MSQQPINQKCTKCGKAFSAGTVRILCGTCEGLTVVKIGQTICKHSKEPLCCIECKEEKK